MHVLELFFCVPSWICIYYDGQTKDIRATEFEKWNYLNMEELARLKSGLGSRERRFLKRITKPFTSHYQPLIPNVSRLLRAVFPMVQPWEKEDKEFYSRMKEILRVANGSRRLRAITTARGKFRKCSISIIPLAI
jgi:hypothetical protein